MKKMKYMSIIWGMLIVGIFIVLTLFGFLYKNKTKEYRMLEDKLVEAEKKYADQKFLYPNEGESIKTSLKELMAEGLIDEFKVNDVLCDGYVILSHKDLVFDYKGYVHCGDYKTKGYED